EDERRAGALLAGAHEGLAAEARKPLLLARLGESPFDSATLEELRAVLESLQATTTGQAAADLDQLRGRVIARYRTIFAWEAHLTGDERLLRVHLRDASRMNPRSGDLWFLEVAHRLESGRRDEAVESVTGWKASAASATLPALTGVDGFSLIANHPAVLRALSTP
ncbi:MAG: hypothetical protein KDB18_11825, partial [Salinibacterium sp.]|nr:hypothetical protein [Salinibacterium sp.]